MSNMEEGKEVSTMENDVTNNVIMAQTVGECGCGQNVQSVGECGCGQNVQGRRPQYMPQFAPQGGRRQYQPFGAGVQQGQRNYGHPDRRPPVSPSAPSSGRRPGESENCPFGHEHRVDTKKLLAMIDKASFAMDDTRLFLDTHPDSKEALAFFKKMEKIRNEAIKEYEIHCGPILPYRTSEAADGNWNWNKGPLPWDNECCNGRRV